MYLVMCSTKIQLKYISHDSSIVEVDLSVFLVPFLASDLNCSTHPLVKVWIHIAVHSLTTALSKSVFQQLSPGISEFHASDTDDEHWMSWFMMW